MPPPHGGLAAKKRNGIARVATRVPPPIRPHFQTDASASAARGACTSDMPTQSVGTRQGLTYDNRETT